MNALEWQGPRRMEVVDRPAPQPAAGEVAIRVTHVGICGSELEGYLGTSSLRVPPLIMGHEFSGDVAGVGEGVDPAWVGRRATVHPLVGCGRCALCVKGLTQVCPARQIIGVHRPGGFAEVVAVPVGALVALPDAVPSLAGALAEPVAVALRAVRKAAVRLGDTVVVIGAGTVGLLICRLASAAGARLVAIDTNPARLELARAQGAAHTVLASAPGVDEAIWKFGGRYGIDVAFDAVGRTVTRALALRIVRPAGLVVAVGIHDAASELPVNDMVRWEIGLIGTFAYTRQEFEDAVELLARGTVAPTGWVVERSLAEGPEVFRALIDAPPAEPKVVLRPDRYEGDSERSSRSGGRRAHAP